MFALHQIVQYLGHPWYHVDTLGPRFSFTVWFVIMKIYHD